MSDAETKQPAGGPLDGVALSCLDELAGIKTNVCVGYRDKADAIIDGLPVSPFPSLDRQRELTALLKQVAPVCQPSRAEALNDMLARAAAPVAIAGRGLTWRDRLLGELRFRNAALADR